MVSVHTFRVAYSKRVKNGWRFEVARNGIRESRTFKTKAEGALWAASREAEILAVKRGGIPRKTFAEALERYRDEISPRKRGGTWETKRINATIRDFPEMAKRALEVIDSRHLSEWRDARLVKVTRGTVQRDINLLSHVFTIARDEWKWCKESPFVGFRAPGDNPARVRRIEPSEIRRILRRMGHRSHTVPASKQAEVAFAFLISLRTGMRAGEILSLTPARIDTDRRLASVPHKTMHLTGRPREVPLSKQAIRLLHVFREGFLWTVKADSLSVLFGKARDQLLIHDLHFHDARADALTRFARKVDVMQLARISGHRDLRILLDHYYRATPASIADALDSPTSKHQVRSTGVSGG